MLRDKKFLADVLTVDMNVRLSFISVCFAIAVGIKLLGYHIETSRLAIFLVLTLIYYVVFKIQLYFGWISVFLKYLYNFFDALLIIYAIDSTGGINSPFYLCFILMPLSEAFSHSNHPMVLFSGLVPCVLYPAYFVLITETALSEVIVSIIGARTAFLVIFTAISAYYQRLLDEEKKKREKADTEVREINRSLASLIEERTRELREAQEQLMQSAKMAAVGQLASGTAHELNNPLTVILGHAQILLQKKAGDEETTESLKEIESYTRRCRNIIQDMLGFSRKYASADEKLSVNMVISKAIEIARNKIRVNHITVNKRLDDNLNRVNGNRHLLEQVFFNLLVNAYAAMPDGGTVTITTGNGRDGRVWIEVEDDGIGISGMNLPKVFDPFFTTKAVGKGTGLGLFVTYSIIERSGGTIRVESGGEGKGAKFIINLPGVKVD